MRKGFSLVELSIVLVILGLLVGGILAGRSLIRASELRAISTEYQRLLTSTQAFRDKYLALPGDITNATRFWGTATHCPGSPTQGSTDASTCNGNGDGRITTTGSANEMFRFWQHLANAGLLEGTYSGVVGGTVNVVTVVTGNAPASKFPNAYWHTQYWGPIALNGMYRYDMDYGHGFGFGGLTPDTWCSGSVLKPEELWNIDTKLDDGLPGRGKLIAHNLTWCTESLNSTDFDKPYRLINNNVACNFTMRMQY